MDQIAELRHKTSQLSEIIYQNERRIHVLEGILRGVQSAASLSRDASTCTSDDFREHWGSGQRSFMAQPTLTIAALVRQRQVEEVQYLNERAVFMAEMGALQEQCVALQELVQRRLPPK